MKLKVNIPMLAESEMELRVLATRMRAIADEVYAVRSSLLSFGETFRHEASLTGRKQDKLIEESDPMEEVRQQLKEKELEVQRLNREIGALEAQLERLGCSTSQKSVNVG